MKTSLLTPWRAGRRGIVWLGLLLLAAASAQAQAPANDDPTGAIVLPVGATCTPTAGTTIGATNTAANGYLNTNCGGISGPGSGYTGGQADVWYRFATPAAGAAASRAVRLTLTGTAAGLVRVFTTPVGSAGPFSEVRCASSGAASTAVGDVDLIGLQPSTVYYVLVGGYLRTDPPGPFTICVSDPTPCGDPQNVAVSGIGATTAQLDFRPGNGNVSYTVVVTRQGFAPVTITPAPTTAPIFLTSLVTNSAYTVTLQANCANGGTSAVFTRTFSTTTSNDEPQDAIVLPVRANCVPTNSTTADATPSLYGSNASCGNGNRAAKDVWFKFTVASSMQIVIQVTGNSAGLVQLYTNQSTPPAPQTIDCSSGSNAPGQTAPPLYANVSPGTDYYISVAPGRQSDPTGPFTICLSQVNGLACRPPVQFYVSANGPTTAQVSFYPSPFSNPSGYTITATPQGTGSTVIVTAPVGAVGTTLTANLAGLTPGTLYTLSIVTNCGATVAAAPVTINFTTPYLSPANEPCSGAIPISCGQTLAGTLNGTSPSNPLVLNCNGSNVGPTSVYYSLVGTGNPITVNLCSPNTQVADNSLIVLQGGCNNLTCIGASMNDPACPTRNAKVTFISLAGQRYTIVVQNQRSGTFTGNFDLTATCAAPVCGAATGVAVSAITQTSARVAWVAPVGGAVPSAYTVTLARSGNPTLSATATGSPVTFSGLLPNTTYSACVTTNCGAVASAPSCAAAFTTPLSSRNAALAGQLGLFPNPAQGSATLTVPAALLRQNGLLSLIDGLGRVVQQRFVTPAPGRSTETRTALDLRGLPAGVYTLRLLSSEGPLTKRLVVE